MRRDPVQLWALTVGLQKCSPIFIFGRTILRGGFESSFSKSFITKRDITLKGNSGTLSAGSKVTGVKVIASGQKIKDIKRLVRENKLPNGKNTKVADWKKMRGTATVQISEGKRKSEIHWYECKNIGKIEFKIKRVIR